MSQRRTYTSRYERKGPDVFGHQAVDNAPDSRPAVRLRSELARSRRLGLPFDEAWESDVALVLGALSGLEHKQWSIAFVSTRSVWMAAYQRTEPSTALTSALLAA